MSDVKVEYEQTISRSGAAAWLSQLALAFTGDDDAEFPFGPGTVKLQVPGSMRVEVEVEVDDDEVEVEIEFSWPLTHRAGEPTSVARPAKAARGSRELANGAVQRQHAGRVKRK